MRLNPDGSVDLLDRGPSEGSAERVEWLREHRGPHVIKVWAAYADEIVSCEPQRYSFERN